MQAGVMYDTLLLSPLTPDDQGAAQADDGTLGWADALRILCMGAKQIAKPKNGHDTTADPETGKLVPKRPATAHHWPRSASYTRTKDEVKQHERPFTAHGGLRQTKSSECIHTSPPSSEPTIPDTIPEVAMAFVSALTHLLQRAAYPPGRPLRTVSGYATSIVGSSGPIT